MVKNNKIKCKNCAKLIKEREEFKGGWQRALADYKNLQDDLEKKKVEMSRWSEEKILRDFIPVYENFKKAFAVEAGEEAGTSWREGIGHIMKQFGDVLKSYGLEEIKTVGEKVDLNLHEVMGEAADKKKEAGIIIQEVSGGYKRGDKVLVPARVIVVK